MAEIELLPRVFPAEGAPPVATRSSTTWRSLAAIRRRAADVRGAKADIGSPARVRHLPYDTDAIRLNGLAVGAFENLTRERHF